MAGRSADRHAIVVGAGIVGTTSALALRRRGWRVTLIENGPIPNPRATSVDASRIVRMDYGADREMTVWARNALAGWDEWNRSLFDRPLFHRTGFLLLARAPLTAGGFEFESLRSLEALGEAAERLDEGALAARFPLWAQGPWVDGYLSPRAGWAESGAVVDRLSQRARHDGVEVVDGRVEALLDDVTGVSGARLASGRTIGGDVVVVSTGAWAPDLVPELAAAIAPRAMPVFYFRPDDPEAFRPPAFPVWAGDIATTGWYGFPIAGDGLVKLGHHGTGWAGHPERPGEVAAEWEERCRAFLGAHLPALAGAPLARMRACYYADARDGDFWIARHPERRALVVATGGSGHGFKFGPLIGDWVADAVEGRPSPALTRFRWRPTAEARREYARADT